MSEIKDFGVKIPGSKKEQWAMQLTAETVTDLSVYDLYRITKKDIWVEPDYKAYCAEGVPVEYMFYVYMIYHSLASKPLMPSTQANDVMLLVQRYIAFLTELRNYLLTAVRAENFAFTNSLWDDFLLKNEYVNATGSQAYMRMLTSKALESNAFDKRFVKLIATTHGTRWPAQGYTAADMYKLYKDGTTNPEVRIKLLNELPKDAYYTLLMDCYISGFPNETATCMFGTWFASDGKTYVLRPENARCKPYMYESPDRTLEALYRAVVNGDCRKYVVNKLQEQVQKVSAEREENARVQAEQQKTENVLNDKIVTRIELPNKYVYRKAPKIRKADARTEFLVYAEQKTHSNSFGFRGGEFGNWQNKRQECLNCTVDAFSDLAYALDLPYQAMSLCFTGKLCDRIALAWGSRGSGRATAHYEPENAVINLTKYRGAGSLAHEWGHALDHTCGKLYTNCKCKRVSDEFMTCMVANGIRISNKPDAAVINGLYQCYEAVLDAIKQKTVQMTLEETVDAYKKQRANASLWVESYFKKVLQNMTIANRVKYADTVDAYCKKVLTGSEELQDIEQQIRLWGVTSMYAPAYESALKHKIEVLRCKEPTEPAMTTKYTQYYVSAKALDNRTTTKRQYYALPQELFARAFESYVEDKLGDIVSQYLVYGTKDLTNHTNFGIDMYPLGEERTAINTAIDKLITYIRTNIVKASLPQQIRKFYTTSVFADSMYFADAEQLNNTVESTNKVDNANNNTDEQGEAKPICTAKTAKAQVGIQYNSSIVCEIIGKTCFDGKPAVKLKITATDTVVVKPIIAVKRAVDAGLISLNAGAEYLNIVS